MPISDELEALRQTGRVRRTSTALQSSAQSFKVSTPAEQEIARKLKSQKDKQSRLEAQEYMRKHQHAGMNDLLYRKLKELKKKAMEREKRRQWERKVKIDGKAKKVEMSNANGGAENYNDNRDDIHDAAGGESDNESIELDANGNIIQDQRGEATIDDDDDEEDNEGHLDTLAMLPDHVITALKDKYQTTNAVEALDRALKEEDSEDAEGRGFLETVLAEVALVEEKSSSATGPVDLDDDVVSESEREDDTNPEEIVEDAQEMLEGKIDAAVAECKTENTKVGDVAVVAAVVADEKESAQFIPEESTESAKEANDEEITIPKESAEIEEATDGPEHETDASSEEVTEKIEQLTIGEEKMEPELMESPEAIIVVKEENTVDDDKGEDPSDPAATLAENTAKKVIKQEEANETIPATTTIEEPNIDPTTIIITESSELTNEEKIQQTKHFYNTHAETYIANAITFKNDAGSHRKAFLGYLNQQQLITKALSSPSKHQQSTPKSNTPNSPDSVSTPPLPSSPSSPLSPSFQIIDLGCGHGNDTLHFSSLGHNLLSIDYSLSMLQHAKTHAPHAHYLNMDMRHFCSSNSNGGMLIPQSIDGVWANASLLHLPKEDVKALLGHLYIAVKVGGVLYFNLKLGEEGEMFEADSRYSSYNNNEDNENVDNLRKLYSYFSMEEVKEILTVAGWDVMEMGEDDRRGLNEYVTHSFLYVFATKKR